MFLSKKPSGNLFLFLQISQLTGDLVKETQLRQEANLKLSTVNALHAQCDEDKARLRADLEVLLGKHQMCDVTIAELRGALKAAELLHTPCEELLPGLRARLAAAEEAVNNHKL